MSALCALVLLGLGAAPATQARVETIRWQQPAVSGVTVDHFMLYASVAVLGSPVALVVDSSMYTLSGGTYSWVVDFDQYPVLKSIEDQSIGIAMSAVSTTGAEGPQSNGQTLSAPVVNSAPNGTILLPNTDVTIAVGESLGFHGMATDPDGDPVSYAWDFDGAPVPANITTLSTPGFVAFDVAGTYEVSLTVTDDRGLADPTPAIVTVTVSATGGGGSSGGSGLAGIAGLQPAGIGLVTAVHAAAPMGDPRVFVVESRGLIRVVEGGLVRQVPFLDLQSRVSGSGNGGLLGLAFDPDYENNGYFFVIYLNSAGDTRVSRFQVSVNPYVADPGSEQVLLGASQPAADNSEGAIAFGPDGFLYVALGDGGGGFDPAERAQNPMQILGKVLRLDVAVPPLPTSISAGAYSIPADNPFVGVPGAREEIWALGVRNPYRISFDRGTGDLWLPDQGAQSKEEINFQLASDPGGLNFGWDVMEGTGCNPTDPAASPACGDASLTDPIYEYDQTAQDCRIIGGYVYRGVLPDMQGEYFYADGCSGKVYSYDRLSDRITERTSQFAAFTNTPPQIVGFGEGGNGELYLVDRGVTLYKLRGVDPECSDGLDNDGDGAVDYPQDPGCYSADATHENPLCDDQMDNDGDMMIDVLDPDCRAAWQNVEAATHVLEQQPLCGLGADLVLFFPPLMWLRRRVRGR